MNKEDISLITFLLDDKTFAVTIEEVQEITAQYEIITVPGAPPFIEGVVNLRGNILPVLDLGKKIGFKQEVAYKNLLIVKVQDNILAIKVSAIVGVLNTKESHIEEIPALLSTQINKKYLKGIIKKKTKEGNQQKDTEILIFVLSLSQILALDEQIVLKKSVALAPIKVEEKEETTNENTMRLATFYLLQQCFGLPISLVQEIIDIDVAKVTPLPYLPPCFLGVINLRGNILWVIDIREFLGLTTQNDNRNIGQVIVIQYEEKQVGIFVDKMGKIENYPTASFQAAPSTLEGTKAEFIKGEIFYYDNLQRKEKKSLTEYTQEIKESIKQIEEVKEQNKEQQIIVVLNEARIFKLPQEVSSVKVK